MSQLYTAMIKQGNTPEAAGNVAAQISQDRHGEHFGLRANRQVTEIELTGRMEGAYEADGAVYEELLSRLAMDAESHSDAASPSSPAEALAQLQAHAFLTQLRQDYQREE